MLKLIIEDDEGRKTVVPFVRDEITIGRQEGNTIRLTERNVSRRHARLSRQNGHVVVEDLGSYNGIRVNGEKIAAPSKVRSGDLIQIGDYDLAIQDEAQAAAPPPAAHPSSPAHPVVTAALGNGAGAQAAQEEVEDTLRPQQAEAEEAEFSEDAEEVAAEAELEAASRRSTPVERSTGARQTTAVIRMDQLDGAPSVPAEELDAAEAPRLVVMNTELSGREFACIRTELRIGRTDENDIQIDHRSMSRTHARLVREANGEWRVVDLQSANGLKINGEPYAQSNLSPGDVLELGHVRLKFLSPGQRYVPERPKRKGLGLYIGAALGALALLGGTAAYVFTRPEAPTVASADAVSPAPASTQAEAQAAAAEPETVAAAPPAENAAAKAPDPAAQIAERARIAKEQMAERRFDAALETLDGLQEPDGTYPAEVNDLVDEAQAEANARRLIEDAEQQLEAGNLEDALELLSQAEGTTAFKREFDRLKTRTDALAAREARKPRAVSTAASRPPPPVNRTADAQRYLEQGTLLLKKQQFAQARDSLNRCVKADRKMARCHMYLGSAYAKLREIESAARHYRLFVDMAPEDPLAPRVRELLAQYEAQQR